MRALVPGARTLGYGSCPLLPSRAMTSVIQRAWKKEQRPWLHGWVYDMRTGRLEELVRRTSNDLPHPVHRYDLDEP